MPTHRDGTWLKFLGMESGRHVYLSDRKWPTFIFEGWKMADTFVCRGGKLPTIIFLDLTPLYKLEPEP